MGLEERKAIEALFVDDPDLKRLEALLREFNIFEALGAVRVELRHSDFLAYLLDPQQNHGLGDAFLKAFLQRAISSTASLHLALSRIQIDLADFGRATVLREWENVDILIEDEISRLVVGSENKIGSAEHSEQLARYRREIESHYASWTQLYLYLTPEGEPPTDQPWIPIDYGTVCGLVEETAEARASSMTPDVLMLIRHYGQMLRRHIVAESEMADLCHKLYRKHQRALDLIFEFRPDRQGQVRDILEKAIADAPGLLPDRSSKSYIRFVPEEWDTPRLREGQGRTQSGRILMFEFGNMPEGLRLRLTIGPGPEPTRRKLFERARSASPVLRPASRELGRSWSTIWVRTFLNRKDCEEGSLDDAEKKIGEVWGLFVERDLPKLLEALRAERWIWEA